MTFAAGAVGTVRGAVFGGESVTIILPRGVDSGAVKSSGARPNELARVYLRGSLRQNLGYLRYSKPSRNS